MKVLKWVILVAVAAAVVAAGVWFLTGKVTASGCSAPTGVSATHGPDGVTIRWTAPDDCNPANYRVRKKLPGESWRGIALVPGTSHLDSDVVEGETYSYKVRVPRSPNSGVASVTIPAPPPPVPESLQYQIVPPVEEPTPEIAEQGDVEPLGDGTEQPESQDDGSDEYGLCWNGQVNHYVSKPIIDYTGKATHPLTDVTEGPDGNKYAGDSEVLGWIVNDYYPGPDGSPPISPPKREWRKGTSMWVDEGQSVNACIFQVVLRDPADGTPLEDWNEKSGWPIVSPEKYRCKQGLDCPASE